MYRRFSKRFLDLVLTIPALILLSPVLALLAILVHLRADFPRLILRMIRGEPVAPEVGQLRPGVIMMKEYNILGGDPLDFFGSILNLRCAAKLYE